MHLRYALALLLCTAPLAVSLPWSPQGQDNCFKLEYKKSGEPTKTKSKGKPLNPTEKAGMEAAIAVANVLETSPSSWPPGCGWTPSDPNEGEITPPDLSDTLTGLLTENKICKEVAKDAEDAAGTANVHQDIATDNGVNVTNNDGINVNSDYIPKPTEQSSLTMAYAGKHYSTHQLLRTAAVLAQEDIHRRDTTSTNDKEREQKEYKKQIDFLCAAIGCLTNDTPDGMKLKEALCKDIKAINESLCEKATGPPIMCSHCPDSSPPCKTGSGGGGQQFLPPADKPVRLSETVFLPGYSGHVSLTPTTKTLEWDLVDDATLDSIHVECTWAVGGVESVFQPTAITMLSGALAVLVGYNEVSNDGMIYTVALERDPFSCTQTLVHEGPEFGQVFSADNVPGQSSVVMLDRASFHALLFDLRTGAFVSLADQSDDPNMNLAHYIDAGLHYDEASDSSLGLSVTISAKPYDVLSLDLPDDEFVFFVIDSDGDGRIDARYGVE